MERQPQVGHHPLAQHADGVELAEIGHPAQRGDEEDEERQRFQDRVAPDALGRVQEGERAPERGRIQRTSLEHELEHRPDQPGERAGGGGEHDHGRDRRSEQREVRPHRREKTPILLHARLVARRFS